MNTEKLKEQLEKTKAALKKVSKRVWIIAAIVVVALAIAIAVYLNTRPYTVLITGSTSDEISTVMTWLEEQNFTDYIVQNGDTILVPDSQAVRLKSALMMEGYPKKGFAYDWYYENVSALSTEAERNQAALDNLEMNLSNLVGWIDGVPNAQVAITPGENLSYVLDSGRVIEATASVIVDLKDGEILSNEKANAIRNLIGHAVKGLQIDSVSIVDNHGNTYNAVGDGTFDGDASALKLQLEEEWANQIRTKVMHVLAPAYGGEDNVKVSVNCVVEVSTSTINDHTVHLPEYAQDGSTYGAGIIGSIVWQGSFTLNPDATVGGVVGTESNADIPNVVEDLLGNGENVQDFDISGQMDADNSYTDTQTLRSAAYIADCTVSVVINSNAALEPVDEARIRQTTAMAAGISAVVTEDMTADEYWQTKIAVWGTPFPIDEEPAPDGNASIFNLPIPDWIIFAALGGILLFVILLIIILVLVGRRKKKKKQQELLQMQMEQAALDPEQQAVEELLASVGISQDEPMGADIMSLQAERSMALRQDIRQFTEENPEIAAQLLKAWLNGGDDGE